MKFYTDYFVWQVVYRIICHIIIVHKIRFCVAEFFINIESAEKYMLMRRINFRTKDRNKCTIGEISMEYLPKELKELFEYDLKRCKELDLDKDMINISDTLKAHYILADYFTDESSGRQSEKMLVGVRSYGLLASALGRQNVEFAGKRKYTDKLDICSTLFYGLVKDHAFHDGNKRTALLILLYQLQQYGYFPQQKFNEFEKLVVSIADNKLSSTYRSVWKKFDKMEDPEIKTISYILRRLVVKKDNSFHMNITTKEFCKMLENTGVEWILEGQKIKFVRYVRGFIKNKKLTYTINFYGWTRPVLVKMARDTANALLLSSEYPSFSSWADGDSSIYRTVCDFEMPLRRLKDK